MTLNTAVAPRHPKSLEENVARYAGQISEVYSNLLETPISHLLQEKGRIFCVEFVYHYRSDSPHGSLDPEGLVVVGRFMGEEPIAELDLEDINSGFISEAIERVSSKVFEKIRWDDFRMLVGLGFRFSFDSTGESKFTIMRCLKLGGYYTKDQL